MNKATTRKILAIVSVALIVCMMLSVSAFAAGTTAASGGTTATSSTSGTIQFVISIVLLIVIFYFFLIRPEKKRKKKDEELRSSLAVGDEIVTIGGLVGKIVDMSNDKITFETGEDRVRIQVAKWAISRKAK